MKNEATCDGCLRVREIVHDTTAALCADCLAVSKAQDDMPRDEAPTQEVMGYAVERVNNGGVGFHFREVKSFAYFLTGKKGATYGLFRYDRAPHLMFVINARTGKVCALKGNSTFTDEGGVLRARS